MRTAKAESMSAQIPRNHLSREGVEEVGKGRDGKGIGNEEPWSHGHSEKSASVYPFYIVSIPYSDPDLKFKRAAS